MADSIKQIPFASQLPIGGTAGQLLAKIDSVNYNTEWIDSPVPVGSANSFAGFDALGLLQSIPGWTNNQIGGAQVDLLVQPNNTGGANVHNFNTAFDPLQDSPNESYTFLNLNANLDPNLSGFDMGSNGSWGTMLSSFINAQGSGPLGSLNHLGLNMTLGNGVDPISVNGYGLGFGFGLVNNGVTMNGQSQGWGFQPFFDTGVVFNQGVTVLYDFTNLLATGGVPGYAEMNFGPNISAIQNNSNYNVLNSNPNIANMLGNSNFNGLTLGGNVNFDAANTGGMNAFWANHTITGRMNYINGYGLGYNINGATINNNVTAFYDNNNIQSGSNLNGYTNLGLSPNFHAGSTLANYQGLNINPTFDGTYTGNLQLGFIGANGSAVINNVQGIAFSVANLNSPNQKQAFSSDGGVASFNNLMDSSQFAFQVATTGHYQGGTIQIASGSPLSAGQFIFGTNFAWNFLAEDDVGADVTGGLIGINPQGLVGQISVALGKTVHTVNQALIGAGVPPIVGDGGTIDTAIMLGIVGYLPSGGNLSVNNLYGTRIWGAIDALTPPNVWGISVESTLAENYFQKSLVIGGLTKKVTNSDIAFEIQDAKTLLLGYLTDAQEAGLTLVDGMEWYNTDQNEFRGVKAGAIVTFTTV